MESKVVNVKARRWFGWEYTMMRFVNGQTICNRVAFSNLVMQDERGLVAGDLRKARQQLRSELDKTKGGVGKR